MNIFYEIMSWLFDTFVAPISEFFADNFGLLSFDTTPISITMPGSDTIMFTASVSDLFMFAIAILVFVGSIILLVGIIKGLYKMGKRLLGGRR